MSASGSTSGETSSVVSLASVLAPSGDSSSGWLVVESPVVEVTSSDVSSPLELLFPAVAEGLVLVDGLVDEGAGGPTGPGDVVFDGPDVMPPVNVAPLVPAGTVLLPDGETPVLSPE